MISIFLKDDFIRILSVCSNLQIGYQSFWLHPNSAYPNSPKSQLVESQLTEILTHRIQLTEKFKM